jgi:hypothetical protein
MFIAVAYTILMAACLLAVGLRLHGRRRAIANIVILIAGPALAELIQLIIWPSALLIFELIVIATFAGAGLGVLMKCFLGWKKNLLSNLFGFILATLLFGTLMVVYFYYDATLPGRGIGGAIAGFYFLLSFGEAVGLGSDIGSRVQTRISSSVK